MTAGRDGAGFTEAVTRFTDGVGAAGRWVTGREANGVAVVTAAIGVVGGVGGRAKVLHADTEIERPTTIPIIIARTARS